jgi:predicted MFS family arabinose efflux permease
MALGGTGGYIAEFWGWRYGFHLFGIIGVVYAIILFLILRDAPKEQPGINETIIDRPQKEDENKIGIFHILRDLFKSRSYWTIIIYGCLLGMTFWVIYAWLPTYYKDKFNLILGGAGVSATAFIQVSSFIGVILGGILADRWSRINIRGRLYVPFIGFMLGGPFLFLMATTGVFGIAIASIIIFGIAKGFHDSNFMPIISQVVDKRYRATGYGMMSFFSVITGAIMIYAGGALKDANISLSFIFQISAVGVLLAGLILLTLKLKKET